MQKSYWFPLFVIGFALLSGFGSCKHEPFLSDDDDIMPIDTTSNNPVDTTTNNPGDTTSVQVECDTTLIYFEQQILPILRSNCAISGCHDAASAKDEVVLDSYVNVFATGEIKPGDLSDSDLYERLVEDKEDRRMPPAPRPRLNQDQIKLIGDWILQGAENLTCDATASGECNTIDVTFTKTIAPVITNVCLGCHNGSSPSGGVSLNGYDNIKKAVDNGKLMGAISWQQGYSPMPKGGDQLSACTIDQFRSWVDDGAPNN